jgi:hypothetical protein
MAGWQRTAPLQVSVQGSRDRVWHAVRKLHLSLLLKGRQMLTCSCESSSESRLIAFPDELWAEESEIEVFSFLPQSPGCMLPLQIILLEVLRSDRYAAARILCPKCYGGLYGLHFSILILPPGPALVMLIFAAAGAKKCKLVVPYLSTFSLKQLTV